MEHGTLASTSGNSFRINNLALRVSQIILLLVMAQQAAHGFVNPRPCLVTTLEFDHNNDALGLRQYEDAVSGLLKQEKFGALDCLADAARTNKAKLPGGFWALHLIYRGLGKPSSKHATEPDWSNHIVRLQRWVAARPNSITARVALAESYMEYGWTARGDGYGDSVSNSGWKIFAERHNKAKVLLEQAATLHDKCPEWYSAMQRVALGQGWSREQAGKLFQQAIAFEPGYYYYYQQQANYLLPKWYGEEGETEQFVNDSADRIGGEAGDVLYFKIAVILACNCEHPQFMSMSWPRIKNGYAALEKQSGQSVKNLNVLALMAVKEDDSELADSIFKRIGDDWDESLWRTESSFKQDKTWAEQFAPSAIQLRKTKEEAEANLTTAEGTAYKKIFDQKFTSLMQRCVQSANGNREKFAMMVRVGKQGAVEGIWMARQTPVVGCLFSELMKSQQTGAIFFPPPPHPAYWMKLELDPAMFDVAAK